MNITLSEKTLHFKKPARTSRGEYSEHRMVIVTITDDDGKRVGVGECAPLPDLSCDRDAYGNLSAVSRLLTNALVTGNYEETLRPYPALLFAFESALCAYEQKPQLYDTPFARGEVGIPFNGLIWMSTFDEMLEQVRTKLSQGFRCIKIKIGSKAASPVGDIDDAWERELELLRLIRSEYGRDSLELRVDANGAFAPEDAMNRLEMLARFDLHSIEQPIRQQQWDDMARLCKESPLPIALDEELIGVNSLDEKRELLDTIRPQYIVIKPTLHGGMSGSREWIDEANKRGIGSWITSALESNIGLQSVALFAASVYGDNITFPQGLGTGQLFTDNIPMPIQQKGSEIWRI